MADQIGPQGGAGSPTRRSEPRPAAPPGESRQGDPHGAHDGVPEIVDTPIDRQSRRYAHTLRRGGDLSGPVRAGQDPSSPVRASDLAGASRIAEPGPGALDDSFDAATITKPKPARPADLASPALEHANRSSAPSDSTALYRKRTNPTLPTISPDLLARTGPASTQPPAESLSELALDSDPSAASGDDAPSRLPSVVLDSASTGIVVYPLALPRPPVRLILTIIAIALVMVAIWCFRSMF